jgi:DNA-binding NarL/FixJ family response regulator
LGVVAQASDAEDLVRTVGAHRPDAAVIDIRAPITSADDALPHFDVAATNGAVVRCLSVDSDTAARLVRSMHSTLASSTGAVARLLLSPEAVAQTRVESL